jgi:hypothetical protein
VGQETIRRRVSPWSRGKPRRQEEDGKPCRVAHGSLTLPAPAATVVSRQRAAASRCEELHRTAAGRGWEMEETSRTEIGGFYWQLLGTDKMAPHYIQATTSAGFQYNLKFKYR